MTLFIVILAFLIIACALTWFLISNDHGQKEPVNALWLAVGFGFIGAVIAATAEYFLVPSSYINGSDETLGLILGISLIIGLIEEICKFLPLASYIYKKSFFNEHTDGIIYFAIAGLTFGVPENVLYTLKFGTSVGLTRIVLTPIFHASLTAMVGYFLAQSKVEHKSLLKTGLALGLAVVLHGLYDFGLTSKRPVFTVASLMITAGLAVVLFVLYMRANEIDRQLSLSVVSSKNFCQSCGQSNPNHYLYCTHCGHHV